MPQHSIALIHHPESYNHVQPFPKPNLEAFDTPLRIQVALEHLKKAGMLEQIRKVQAPRAEPEEVLLVHSPYVLDSVTLMSHLGSGELGEAAHASPDLLDSVLLAVGGAMRAAELAMTKDVKHAFSLMRPPGHHASTSTSMGLCYFNNLAIAVKHAMKQPEIDRVSIIDFDDHFGNGTAEIFYSNPHVQYISIHEYDYENMGLGHGDELGHGDAAGTNINIPLVESSPDVSYQAATERIVIPAVEKFEPSIIAVSAGYDAHYADPVGNMNVDSRTFWKLGNAVNKLVDKMDLPGSFLALEGGYNPFVMGPSIEATLRGLNGEPMPKLEDQLDRVDQEEIVDANENILDGLLAALEQFW